MNSISLTPAESQNNQEVFLADANKILLLQQDVNEMQEQLDKIMESAQKREFQHGHFVEFEKIISIKQISEALEPKQEELKEAVLALYHSLFPGDIFITQNFFNVWISMSPHGVIRFSDDLESIEMKNDIESQSN
jgi:hypothetical protein